MEEAKRLEVDVLVEEFRALRAELTTRIEKQQDITNFAVVILVGMLAAAKAVEGEASTSDALLQLRLFFPWISIVLSSFTLMTLDHEMNIAHIPTYVYLRLRFQMETALHASKHASGLWEWNAYRAAWQQHAGPFTVLTSTMASAKYLVTMVPNLLLTAAYWYTRPVATTFLNWTWGVYLVSVALLVLVVLTAGYTSRAYMSMNYRRDARLKRSFTE